MPLDNDGNCTLTELISSLLDRIPNLLSFKSKWSSIRVKLADLNTHLSDISASSSTTNQLSLDLLLSLRETLHDASSVAARCEGPDLSEGKLKTQSDVDSITARLDRHAKDAEVLIRSGLLNEIVTVSSKKEAALRNLVIRLQIGEPESKNSAIDSLLELVQGDDKNVMISVAQGVVPVLVRLLDSCSLSVKEKVVAVISRISYIAWIGVGSKGSSRLLSSSIDGTISEWDLFDLKHKVVLDSIGVSIWQMAVAPPSAEAGAKGPELIQNGYLTEKSDDEEESGTEDELGAKSEVCDRHLAAACDDGCVRIYSVSESDKLTYYRSLPRVSGRALSVTWSLDAQRIFSGSSDGLIRCWDANLGHEVYRITVGLGGLGNGSELCIWSLLALRCGVLVSGDSTGTVQFWDSQHGTLLQAHSNHKGDVNALAAAPSHDRVFSAGADGQLILYKLAGGTFKSQDLKPSSTMKWDYISCARAHTHDIRALTVAVPISSEGTFPDRYAKRKSRKQRKKDKPTGFSYHKWAHLGAPMLISAGDDAKLFAYSVQEFTKFSPHDICPAPQRVPMQMVHNTVFNQTSLLMVQESCSLDILRIHISSDCSGRVSTKPLVRVKSKDARKIICSAISNTGSLFAYSDQIRPSLFELEKSKLGKNPWSPNRKRLPSLPFAHSMVFSCDSSRLIIAGHDRKIYIVEIDNMELLDTLTPRQEGQENDSPPPREPPITKMYTSSDDHWLAAINCFGDIYVFDLETQKQHWFMSRLDGASVAAAGFHPRDNNMLVISTSSNQVFALDVEARELGNWSLQHTFYLPKSFQEFTGEVVGLSFSPSPSSSSVIIYSSRAKCLIEFGKPTEQGVEMDLTFGSVGLEKLGSGNRKRRLEEYKKESKKGKERETFEMGTWKHPVLYLRHLSKSATLVVEKPWIEVVKGLDSQPVHRHIFGT